MENTKAGGGAYEIAVGAAIAIEDDRGTHDDIYDPVAREAMLARFAQLPREP